jgi:TnpA family transposase
MSEKSVLSVLEQNGLIGLNEELIVFHHTFSSSDLMIIKQRRGVENRLGFAVQLCYMRYPGFSMPDNPSEKVIEYAATQLDISSIFFDDYGKRKNTIYDHSVELQTIFGFGTITTG